MIRQGTDYDIPDVADVQSGCDEYGIDFVAVRVKSVQLRDIHIFLFYVPPASSACDVAFWNGILNDCMKFRSCIIMGDFNAHAALWSLPGAAYNVRGRALERCIIGTDLVSLNDASPTWCSADLASWSILDLVFASSSLSSIFAFRVLDHTYGSDQFPLVITNRGFFCSRRPRSPCMLTALVDWNAFGTVLESETDNISFSYSQPLTTYNTLCNVWFCLVWLPLGARSLNHILSSPHPPARYDGIGNALSRSARSVRLFARSYEIPPFLTPKL